MGKESKPLYRYTSDVEFLKLPRSRAGGVERKVIQKESQGGDRRAHAFLLGRGVYTPETEQRRLHISTRRLPCFSLSTLGKSVGPLCCRDSVCFFFWPLRRQLALTSPFIFLLLWGRRQAVCRVSRRIKNTPLSTLTMAKTTPRSTPKVVYFCIVCGPAPVVRVPSSGGRQELGERCSGGKSTKNMCGLLPSLPLCFLAFRLGMQCQVWKKNRRSSRGRRPLCKRL